MGLARARACANFETALVIYALGSALGVFTISLVKSPAVALADQPHSETQDFNIVVLTKTLGFLLGTPFMTALWVKGIGLGGAGLGLPYFVSGVSGPVFMMLWSM